MLWSNFLTDNMSYGRVFLTDNMSYGPIFIWITCLRVTLLCGSDVFGSCCVPDYLSGALSPPVRVVDRLPEKHWIS